MFMTLFVVLSKEIIICSVLYLSITHALVRRILMIIFGTALGTKQPLRKLSVNTCSDT